MHETQFNVGVRVQVTDDWFEAELRGKSGAITEIPEGFEDHRDNGVYWVQFDPPQGLSVGSIDAAEIDSNSLRRV
jgi:hypothetical protein